MKTKENTKSYIACSPGLEKNCAHCLNDLNRWNMDHFSAEQETNLFALKRRSVKEVKLDDDVSAAYSTVLTTARDASAVWLAWV